MCHNNVRENQGNMVTPFHYLDKLGDKITRCLIMAYYSGKCLLIGVTLTGELSNGGL